MRERAARPGGGAPPPAARLLVVAGQAQATSREGLGELLGRALPLGSARVGGALHLLASVGEHQRLPPRVGCREKDVVHARIDRFLADVVEAIARAGILFDA